MSSEEVERPGRCYPAAVLVEPAIACFGRVGDKRVILEKPSLEIQCREKQGRSRIWVVRD